MERQFRMQKWTCKQAGRAVTWKAGNIMHEGKGE
jgi:hypothetical protein